MRNASFKYISVWNLHDNFIILVCDMNMRQLMLLIVHKVHVNN